MTLPFVEAFGPTLQGEGAAAGRLSSFLRFGGCNLSCSWCDSAYTWDASQYNLREEIQLLSAAQILERVPFAPILVVTGGEPLLNQRRPEFLDVLEGAKRRGMEVHMETNGTLVPTLAVSQLVDLFSVSPKLGHAGEHKKSQDPTLASGWALIHDTAESHLKVVCKTLEDVRTTHRLAQAHKWPTQRVWVMPEGTDSATLNTRFAELADECVARGMNLTHRLHVIAWGDERGR